VGLSCFEGDPAGTRHGKGQRGARWLGPGREDGPVVGGGGSLGWLETDASAGRKTGFPRSVHGTIPPSASLLAQAVERGTLGIWDGRIGDHDFIYPPKINSDDAYKPDRVQYIKDLKKSSIHKTLFIL
jgi:hypothetical protein